LSHKLLERDLLLDIGVVQSRVEHDDGEGAKASMMRSICIASPGNLFENIQRKKPCVNFINILPKAFMGAGSKSVEIQSSSH